MSTKETGGPAFPQPTAKTLDNGHEHMRGMSLRDYFAAKALQGMLADIPKSLYGPNWKNDLVEASYLIADAMIEERAK